MATKTIEVIISADSQKLISELKKGNTSLGDFGGNVGSASKSTTAFSSELGGLAKELGLTLALGEVISQIGQFSSESVAAAKESAAATAQLNAVLTSTKGIAGLTSAELQDMATSLENTTMFTGEAVMGAESLLLTFTNIGRDVFPRATQVVTDMSQALGQDLKSSAIQLGKALQDPVDGVTALRRVGVNFNDDQKTLIETMVKTGDTAGAQAIILKELETEFGGSAAAARDAAGSSQDLKVSYDNLQEAVGGLILQIKGSGINEFLIGLYDSLSSGATAWSENLGPMQAFFDALSTGVSTGGLFNDVTTAGKSALEGVVTWYAQGAAGLAELVFGQDAVVAAAQSAVAAYGNQTSAINSNTNTINTNKTANDELTNSLVNQEEQRTKLSSIDGSYFSTLQKYQEDATKSAEEYAVKVGELSTTTAEKRTKTETDTAAKISQLNIEEAQKRADLITRGQALGAASLQSQLDANTRYYDQKRAQVQKDSTDELATLDKTNAEKLAKLNEARAKEQEEQRKHLEQLKLQTALNVLETTGELEKLTGIAGLKAKDAYELVTAGVIQIDGKLGTALQTTISSFSQQQSNISAQAKTNQQTLQSIYTGSYQGIADSHSQMVSRVKADDESLKVITKESVLESMNSIRNLTIETVKAQAAANDAASAFARMQSAGLSAGQAASGARYTGLASYYGAYQTGGQFTVGGNGGRDSQMVNFRASPGEIVTVAPPGQGGNVNNSVANNQQSKTYNLYIQGGNSMNISSEFKLLEALG